MTVLTAAQRAVVEAPLRPLRVMGSFLSGKTTALVARANRLADECGPRRVLLLVRSRAVAEKVRHGVARGVEVTTLVDHALGVLMGRWGPTRLVEQAEQLALVEGMLTGEGRAEWPTMHDHLADIAFAEEIAAVVLRYEASFLGDEELRAHTDAAGVLDRWEELAGFARRYLAELEARRAVDTAGAVVQASLLLRDDSIVREQHERYAAVLVDDYELASFATNRLIGQLAGGPGGPVTVAGNPAAAIAGQRGGTATYLERFSRRFAAGGDGDVELTTPMRTAPRPWLVTGDRLDEPVAVAEKLEKARADGYRWSDMAVLTRTEAGARRIASRLPRGFSVTTIDGAAGLEWPVVVVAECTAGRFPADRPEQRWFDLELLSGPDVPDASVRDQRWLAEEGNRFGIATTRAIDRLVLVAPPPPSPLVV